MNRKKRKTVFFFDLQIINTQTVLGNLTHFKSKSVCLQNIHEASFSDNIIRKCSTVLVRETITFALQNMDLFSPHLKRSRKTEYWTC